MNARIENGICICPDAAQLETLDGQLLDRLKADGLVVTGTRFAQHYTHPEGYAFDVPTWAEQHLNDLLDDYLP